MIKHNVIDNGEQVFIKKCKKKTFDHTDLIDNPIRWYL